MSGTGIAAVLSGGGAKAAAHVGAVRAMMEAGVTPACYAGCSMGAVVGAAFAAGLGADEVMRRLIIAGRTGVARAPLAPLAGLYADGLMRAGPLRRAIEAALPARRFEELRLPLTVAAVDLDDGRRVLFGAGGTSVPLVDALMASCALPVFYPAVTIAGRRYADGGLRGVLPLDAVPGASRIVAVDIGPGFDELDAGPSPYPALLRAHNDACGILMAANTELQLALWRADPSKPPLLYVRPRVERNATFRVDRAAAYAAEGYRATAAALRGDAP